MNKIFVIGFFLSIMLAAILLPHYRVNDGISTDESSFVTNAVLSDSIPADILRPLGLAEVQGVKVHLQGHATVQYFSYSCKKNWLLKAVATIPFQITQGLSDTTYRSMDGSELLFEQRGATQIEIDNAPGFFSATPEHYEAFEFIKAPYRHIILVSKNDESIIHRVQRS